jgi:hypothetical protein
MIKVYRARDIMDAHIVKGLLEQQGIRAHVDGQFLHGAMGELPTMDFVTVSVDDDNAAQARRVIEDYDRAMTEQQADDTETDSERQYARLEHDYQLDLGKEDSGSTVARIIAFIFAVVASALLWQLFDN